MHKFRLCVEKMNWTHEQLDVIEAEPAGNLFLLACAGSGKTSVMTKRVAFLVNEKGCNPADFCILTFTNPAAALLAKKLKDLLGAKDGEDEMFVGTFHSVSARIVQYEEDRFAHVDEIPVHFLNFLQTGQSTFKYVFIDEAQDLNPMQASIVREMAKTAVQVLLAGDDDQSIYAWRGADPRLLFALASDLNCATKYLSINHRSSPELVTLANSVSSHNRMLRGDVFKPPAKASDLYAQLYFHPKKLWVISCNGQHQELDFLCTTILDGLKRDLIVPEEIAVMARTSRPLHAVHARFSRERLPVSFLVGQDAEQAQTQSIALMTVHGSKGREFRWVFIVDVSAFCFPDPRVLDLEEERRLFYVSVTRAKDRLWILGNTSNQASLFLSELDERDYYHAEQSTGRILPPIKNKKIEQDYLERKQKSATAQLTRFADARQLVNKIDGAGFLHMKKELFVPGWHESLTDQLERQAEITLDWPAWVDAHCLRNDALEFWKLAVAKMLAKDSPCNPREVVLALESDAGWKRIPHLPRNFLSEASRAVDAYTDPNRTWRSLIGEIWTLVTVAATTRGRHVLWHVKPSFVNLQLLVAHCEHLEAQVCPQLQLRGFSNQQVKLRNVFGTRVETVADFQFVGSALVNFVPVSTYGQQDSLISHLAFGHCQAAQCIQQKLQFTKIMFVDLVACVVLEFDFQKWTEAQANALWSFIVK